MDETPLFAAAKQDSKEVAEILIAHGADVNAKNNDNRTPLFRANLRIAKLLLAKGAYANIIDKEGSTMLQHLDKKKEYKLYRLLINHGAKPQKPKKS